MKVAKKPSIDRQGRIVVPKATREQAGLRPGVPLSICYNDGCVEIRPEPAEVKVISRGRLSVAAPSEALPELSDGIVRQARNQVRKRG